MTRRKYAEVRLAHWRPVIVESPQSAEIPLNSAADPIPPFGESLLRIQEPAARHHYVYSTVSSFHLGHCEYPMNDDA